MKIADKCPLCGTRLDLIVNKLGVHCEGLCCKNCNCNARNRFFYMNLHSVISELGTRREPIKILEASSYGYRALEETYRDNMRSLGADVICSDYYQRDFKATMVQDLVALTFEDESLDIICHSHVFEHVEDDMAALREAHRCLKVGGVLLFNLPIQTDFTFAVQDEYHGDAALVYRRNGWDLLDKLKSVGFHVEVRVPPEHFAVDDGVIFEPERLALDNISYGQKFGKNFQAYQKIFYPASDSDTSRSQRFAEICGYIEIFVARKAVA